MSRRIPPFLARKKRSKYGAKRAGSFDSKGEAARAANLRIRQAAGEIRALELQVKFKLSKAEIGYIADFVYERKGAGGAWEKVAEDFKGVETPEFRLKKRLWRAYGTMPLIVSQTAIASAGGFQTREIVEPGLDH